MTTAAQIIDALGGSAEIARDTGFPLTTIESWKNVNFIPEWRRERLLGLAAQKDVELSTADFPAKRRRGDPPPFSNPTHGTDLPAPQATDTLIPSSASKDISPRTCAGRSRKTADVEPARAAA